VCSSDLLAKLARQFDFAVVVCAPAAEQAVFGEVDRQIDGYVLEQDDGTQRYVIVSTQGKGDEAALRAAVTIENEYVGFVGSKSKIEVLKNRIIKEGVDDTLFESLHCPAGLDLSAITPDEIALSILAEIIQTRRRKQRAAVAKSIAS